MHPVSIKHIKKVKKLREKNSHIEGYVLCVHVKLHINPILFCTCKKNKIISQEMNYFSTNFFYFLHNTQNMLGFGETTF
jgi:hypothetical protein